MTHFPRTPKKLKTRSFLCLSILYAQKRRTFDALWTRLGRASGTFCHFGTPLKVPFFVTPPPPPGLLSLNSQRWQLLWPSLVL